MRASHAFAYDAANNRTSAFSAQAGAAAKAMTAAHNNMNQITTLGGGGRTRVAGSLDEPGQVSVGIVGQGDKPARMLSGNRFETELDLPAGTSTLQIKAADGSANLTTKQYSVVTSPETSRTVTHDADGNMTSDGVRTYEWDVWSRLTKITWATGKTTTFHYNALGERTKMVHTDGSTTRTEYYLYDGPRPIQRRSEGTATSNIDREYFSGGERRWNTGTGAWVNHHFTRDHLGSVREVLDSSGNLLARYDYAPYGERTTRYEASGYSSDVGFTGHFHIPSPVSGQSEILLAHYRAYDPVLGRWLSQDPIREAGGINLYGYVGGRVLSLTDLFGLNPDQWSLTHYQDLLMRIESEVPPGGGVEGGGVHIHEVKTGLKYDYNTKTGLFTCRGDNKGRNIGQALPKEIRKAIQNNREIQTKIQRALDRVNGSPRAFAPRFGGGKAGKFLPLLAAVGLGVTADALASRYLAEAQKGGHGYHYLQAAYDLATALPAPDAMQSALLLELAEPPVFAPEDPCQEAVP